MLRRTPDIIVENALNEAAEPFIDSLNTAIFHQVIDTLIFSFVLCLLIMATARRY
jgi:hypothetical protein